MTCSVRLIRAVLAALLFLSVSGCLPSGQSQLEEEKEFHFLAGKNRVSGMDYQGAIEEFKKALESNPRSAAAHFELALLYEQKDPDPAAAIYHFEQYLKWRPNAENAETVRQRIFSCKQDLAKAVMLLPTGPGIQRELEQLAAENKRLNHELAQWRAYARRMQIPANPPAPTQTAVLQAVLTSATHPSPGPAPQQYPAPAAPARTHVVQANETFYSIARKYGVTLDALTNANRGLEPKRLSIGHTLKVPLP